MMASADEAAVRTKCVIKKTETLVGFIRAQQKVGLLPPIRIERMPLV